MPFDCTALTARLRQNDETAFRALFDMYNERLYLFSLAYLKNKEQAEDIVQETFLQLWKNRAQLSEEFAPHILLFTIAKRLTLNALRKQTNGRIARDRFWQKLKKNANETENTVLFNELKRQTEQLLLTLSPQQQQVFRLSRQEGLSYEEIAERLKISPNTVRNHLSSALKQLHGYADVFY